MNNLSNEARVQDEQRHCWSCKPIPRVAIYVLVPVFLLGLGVSIFILAVVHNAALFVSLLSLSVLVAVFLLWNTLNSTRNAAVLFYLHSYPDSDLRLARHGQLVKITGVVMCGSMSLESSYEKASRCVYTSTVLYEYGELGLKPVDAERTCFQWRLAYSERFSTDFYITDSKSGIRALVKAGPDCKVTPLIIESRLINTTSKCSTLSTHFRKWLRDRNLSGEARLLRLEEGYIKEGSSISVIGMVNKSDDIVTIVQPPDLMSTGCLWQKLLLPVDVDGLILGTPRATGLVTNPNSVPWLQH
ncbi:hypothetical protein U1Q18_003451 [Sarracenia purpurea var. burkii]